MGIFWSILGILASGMAGGFAGYMAMTALGLDGAAGALVAVPVGMGIATVVWVAITALLRALRIIR